MLSIVTGLSILSVQYKKPKRSGYSAKYRSVPSCNGYRLLERSSKTLRLPQLHPRSTRCTGERAKLSPAHSTLCLACTAWRRRLRCAWFCLLQLQIVHVPLHCFHQCIKLRILDIDEQAWQKDPKEQSTLKGDYKWGHEIRLGLRVGLRSRAPLWQHGLPFLFKV